MVYKPPLSPGPFENWLSSSSSPPSPPPAPRFVRSFVHPARGVTHHPSPLLLSPGAWAPLTRISAYNGTTSKRVSFLPSIERGKPRQGRILCLCARACICVCVCWWRRSSLATIDEVKVESWNRRILPCFSGIDRSKGVSGVSS